MTKIIKNLHFKTFLFLIIGLGFMVNTAFASDWKTILKKIEKKNLAFEKEVKDSLSLYQITSYISNSKFILECLMYTKGTKNRLEANAKTNEKEKGKEMLFTLCDGKNTYMISPATGEAKKVNSAGENPANLNFDWWKKLPKTSKSVKTSKVNQKECYEITFIQNTHPQFTKIWVDKKNLNLVKANAIAKDKMAAKNIVYIFSDFRKIKNSFELPFTTKAYMENQLLTTISIKDYKINQGLSNDLFDPKKITVKK